MLIARISAYYTQIKSNVNKVIWLFLWIVSLSDFNIKTIVTHNYEELQATFARVTSNKTKSYCQQIWQVLELLSTIIKFPKAYYDLIILLTLYLFIHQSYILCYLCNRSIKCSEHDQKYSKMAENVSYQKLHPPFCYL